MAVKITFIFNNVVGNTFNDINGQVWGWSETFINDGTAISPGVIATGEEMAGYRSQLLGHNSVLQYIRYQLIGGQRQTLLRRWGQAGPNANGDTDIPNTCVLFRLNTFLGPQRSYFLKGIPDGLVTQGGGFFPTTAYLAAIENYFGRLTGTNNFVARGGSFVQVLGTSEIVSQVVSTPNSRSVEIIPLVPMALVVGNLVNIKGPTAAGAPQVRGLHKVTGITTLGFTINVPRVIFPAYNVTGPGLRVYNTIPTYSVYTGYARKNSTERKTGGPFDRPRGRKRKTA